MYVMWKEQPRRRPPLTIPEDEDRYRLGLNGPRVRMGAWITIFFLKDGFQTMSLPLWFQARWPLCYPEASNNNLKECVKLHWETERPYQQNWHTLLFLTSLRRQYWEKNSKRLHKKENKIGIVLRRKEETKFVFTFSYFRVLFSLHT